MEDFQPQEVTHKEELRELEKARRETEDMRDRQWVILLHECRETSSSMTKMTSPHHRGHVPPSCQQLGTNDNLVFLLIAFKNTHVKFQCPHGALACLPAFSSELRGRRSIQLI